MKRHQNATLHINISSCPQLFLHFFLRLPSPSAEHSRLGLVRPCIQMPLPSLFIVQTSSIFFFIILLFLYKPPRLTRIMPYFANDNKHFVNINNTEPKQLNWIKLNRCLDIDFNAFPQSNLFSAKLLVAANYSACCNCLPFLFLFPSSLPIVSVINGQPKRLVRICKAAASTHTHTHKQTRSKKEKNKIKKQRQTYWELRRMIQYTGRGGRGKQSWCRSSEHRANRINKWAQSTQGLLLIGPEPTNMEREN